MTMRVHGLIAAPRRKHMPPNLAWEFEFRVIVSMEGEGEFCRRIYALAMPATFKIIVPPEPI